MSFHEKPVRGVLTALLAAVWLGYGLFAKLLGLVPRHRAIVARFVGEELSAPVTLAVGAAEVGMAVWILSGRRRRLCVVVQGAAIVSMNGLELLFARDLLLSPLLMPLANAALLCVAFLWSAPPRAEAP